MLLPIAFGCSGSGGSSSPGGETLDSTPEAAVKELFNSWKTSNSFRYDSQGKILAQESSTGTVGYITFKDLKGTEWLFLVDKVEYLSDSLATVYTSYYYSGSPQFGGLKVNFHMVKDQGLWFLESMEVIEVPAVVVTGTGINGVITDKVTNLPVSGARVEAYNSSNQLVGYSVTDSSGYYEVKDLLPGTYYLVVSRAGYAPYTISGVVVR